MIDVLADLMITRGAPVHMCAATMDAEFIAIAVREWIAGVGAKTAYIEPGSAVGERLRRKLQRQTAR